MKQNDLKRRRKAVRVVMAGLDLKLAEKRDADLRKSIANTQISSNNSGNR